MLKPLLVLLLHTVYLHPTIYRQDASPDMAERCSVELWEKIFRLACVDGGFTGCSLSLVSRAVRNVAQPVRFNSVALTDLERLLTFANGVLNTRPNIHHLFISVSLPLWGPNRVTQDQRWYVDNIITTILTAAAPTIKTLFLHEPSFQGLRTTLRFPVLQDLEIPQLRWCHGTRPTEGPLPYLRRLHTTVPQSTSELLGLLAEFNPFLTHLRISQITQDYDFPCFLRVLLDIPVHLSRWNDVNKGRRAVTSGETDGYDPGSDKAVRASIIVSRLPDLNDIYVQPGVYIGGGGCFTGGMSHSRMLQGFATIVRTWGDGYGIQTKKLHMLPESQGYSAAESRIHWQDVVNGGDGPWRAEPPRSVAAPANAPVNSSATRSVMGESSQYIYNTAIEFALMMPFSKMKMEIS